MIKKTTPLGSGFKFPTLELPRSGSWVVAEATSQQIAPQYQVRVSLIKSIFFAFIITSVSAYYGYHASGGAINVGKASTKAVVYSSIIILIFNYILTDLILSGISF